MKSPNLEVKGNVKRSLAGDNDSLEDRTECKRVKSDGEKRTLSLSSGQELPVVQFGTYKMKGEECYQAVLAALSAGYRGLDTASVYDNEKEVGRAIADSGLQPGDVFVQTKLWRSFVGPGKNGKPKCEAELRKSLRRLSVERVDLWLIHWPGPGRHLNYPPVRSGSDRPKTELPANQEKVSHTSHIQYFSLHWSLSDGSSQLEAADEAGDVPRDEQVRGPGGRQSGSVQL